MKNLRIAVVFFFCACAMAFPQVVPEAASEFTPTGEISLRSFGASFDKYRIRSPVSNLTVRTDGSWAGTLSGTAIDVSVDENTVRGVDFILSRVDSVPGHVVITGQFRGKMLRFEFDDKLAMIRTPKFSNTYRGYSTRDGVTKYGPGGDMKLKGEAGMVAPPWPQFGLALVAAFEGDAPGAANSSQTIGSDGNAH